MEKKRAGGASKGASRRKEGEEIAASEPESARPNPEVSFEGTLSGLSNAELLGAVDVVLLELEKRLFRYAKVGPELLEMADEGLVLSVRARARLSQALSATQHAEGHLQVVAVGDWRPRSTRPSWHDDPRVTEE